MQSESTLQQQPYSQIGTFPVETTGFRVVADEGIADGDRLGKIFPVEGFIEGLPIKTKGFCKDTEEGVCEEKPAGFEQVGGCCGTHVGYGPLPLRMHTAPGSQQSDVALHIEV